MNILYLHYVGINSEMSNLIQVKSMCAAMARIGHYVTLSLPGTRNSTKLDGNISDTKLYNIQFRENIFNNYRLDKYINYSSVKNTIKSIAPDLCYLRSPLLLKRALKTDKPVIIELHQDKLHRRIKLLDRYWRVLLKKAIRMGKVKKVVCISEALSNYWEHEGISRDIIVTAHDGLDVTQFNEPMEPSTARKELGIPLDKKIIIYTGSLYPNRNIENILKLAEIFQEHIFIIVGGPEENSKYYQKIAKEKKINNVYITGRIPHSEIPKYLFASDILLALWSSKVPTINYCSPLKVFEYMAAGRTIVAQGFPTVKEVLNDGVNSIVCEPDSFNDLIYKFKIALQMPQNNVLSKNARREAMSYYSWDIRVKKIINDIDI